MSEQDQIYFSKRAEAELLLAQLAEHPKAIDAHYELAQSYLQRIYKPVVQGRANGAGS